MPIAIDNYVVKVHSRCNLDCSYCYEYNMGNDGWRTKPKGMSLDVLSVFLDRVREHAKTHCLSSVNLSFHGGEPLLQKPDYFERASEMSRQMLAGVCAVHLGVQTNATLLSKPHIDVFNRNEIVVGVSLDGPGPMNDRRRFYRGGRGSFERAHAGIAMLKEHAQAGIWGGLLAVIDVESDPVEVMRFLTALQPPMIDLLEPGAHWQTLPPGKHSTESTEYADWLIAAFDWWFAEYSHVHIRRFENIIEGMLGGIGTVEYFGTEPVSLLTIATDGAYEAVDQIKSVKNGIENLSMNVFDHPIDSVIRNQLVLDRQIGISALSDACLRCEFMLSCGGGYYPHRYSESNAFRNPSIYCSDYKKLFSHIRRAVEREIDAEIKQSTASA